MGEDERDLEETVSGVKVEGRWRDVVDTGEEITDILADSDRTEGGDLDDWNRWRPRRDEEPAEELKDRTVEEATVEEGPAEKEGKGAVDEAGAAVKEAEKAVENVAEGDVGAASSRWRRALTDIALSIDTGFRKVLRWFESVIYRRIIARTNPQYFDSELVSASLDEKKSVTERFSRREKDGDRRFEMRLNINDDTVKEEVKDELKERED